MLSTENAPPQVKFVDTPEALLAHQNWALQPLVIYDRQLTGDFNGLSRIMAQEFSLSPDQHVSISKNYPQGIWKGMTGSVLERVRQRLTDAQKTALITIEQDFETFVTHMPVLGIESLPAHFSFSNLHIDHPFQQGRLLCAYTHAATEFEIAGQTYQTSIGVVTRHTSHDDPARGIKALEHRRPLIARSPDDAPHRLILKGMLLTKEHA